MSKGICAKCDNPLGPSGSYCDYHYRDWKLRYNYGSDFGSFEFEQLMSLQNNRCAICGTDSPGSHGNTFHVDHDHVTGKVRGLLCFRCNSSIERIDTYPDWLTKVDQYLKGNHIG